MQSSGNNGVILVSFGSTVSSSTKRVDKAVLTVMADAFAKLPQKIIWKLSEGTNHFSFFFHSKDNFNFSYKLPDSVFPLGVLLTPGNSWSGVLLGSSNPNAISDYKMSFKNDEHNHTLP